MKRLGRNQHGARLGYGALRAFNRALHGLIQKGVATPVPAEMITQGRYTPPRRMVNTKLPGGIRFVTLNSKCSLA